MPRSILSIALLLVLAGCEAEFAAEAEVEKTPVEAAEPARYEGRGVVQSITPSKSHVVVAHEAIPGFMDAMTMPMAVQDASLLDGLAPEDSIYFVLVVEAGSGYISEIEKQK